MFILPLGSQDGHESWYSWRFVDFYLKNDHRNESDPEITYVKIASRCVPFFGYIRMSDPVKCVSLGP